MDDLARPIGRLDARELAAHHFGGAALHDARRGRRLVAVAERVLAHPAGTLPQKLGGRAELVGLYRLVEGEHVTHAAVLAPHQARTREAIAAHDGVVLLVHDWTELDFSRVEAVAEELGQIGGGFGRGYVAQHVLAVAVWDRPAAAAAIAGRPPPAADRLGRRVLGLAAQVLHRRREVPEGETPSAKRDHPGRESLVWPWGVAAAGPNPPGRTVIDVCDRGADTIEFLEFAVRAGRRFVVRAAKDRNLDGDDHVGDDRVYGKLFDLARDLPSLAGRRVEVAAAAGRTARVADVEVAAGPVTLRAGRFARGHCTGEPLDLWVVHVREPAPPPGSPALPPGVAPVEWTLLTNLRPDDAGVGLAAFADRVVDYYAVRPTIEEFHKGLKTGLGVEALRFASAGRLGPVVALLSVAAAVLTGARDAARQPDADVTPATDLVPAAYVNVLAAYAARRVAARGPRAHLAPGPDMTVRQFVVEVAKLGGFLARKADGMPGFQTVWRGWAKLQVMVEAVEAAGAMTG
jgi:hypothetical protein